MDYNYEALDDKRFQKLCQALIVAQFPDAQCLPVGEPDGGRDAILLHGYSNNKNTVVFQVKFSRNPDQKKARTAISNLVQKEQTNVKRLISDGATSYYFITNVKGTAFPDSGSIDTVNKFLAESFEIPCQIWWRDDLDRRLEQHSNVKWSYLEILKGSDVLQLLLDSVANSTSKRFERTLKSYLASQYASECDIKFKQVDLGHRLTDLFVDLPLCRKSPRGDRHAKELDCSGTDLESYTNQLRFYESNRPRNRNPFGHSGLVAAFGLSMPLEIRSARIVLEGAPGQGKSTVTQFLCQVNRIRLLGKSEDIQAVPDHIRCSPIRIPFKLDLRNYADWLAGRDPFDSSGTGMNQSRQTNQSLESFLMMHIERYSGGHSVDSDDLIAFLQHSHVVIVLDGFDEVADVDIRARIVDEVNQAAARLEIHSRSIQFIITSRPAAFSSSHGFREDQWTHLKLTDLRQIDIMAYKDKWIKAQGLTHEDSESISTTMEDKLKQPHFRDLARNPMQLAILLYLMHMQGVALPEKRTALYEEYMNLFFNREAQKSTIVRDQRDLLLSIHGRLAWVLHTQVEDGIGSGRMSDSALQKCVREFLESEGHGTDVMELVDQLVQGAVERIGALVSRVSGTFEFEVQPLREYFAARYLHETSPYSPPGREQKGTRADRFEALAQNSFWTNVTRFFCGFYDKGELSSLVDGITHLGTQSDHSLINQSRRLAIMLLSDHVFSQVPRVVNRLIEFVTSEPGFQRLYSVGPPHNRREVEFPENAGRPVLFQTCLSKLEVERDPCRRHALREIMANNAKQEYLKRAWKSRFENGLMTCDALVEAEDFGIIDRFNEQEIREIARNDAQLCVRWLVKSHHYSTIVGDRELYDVAVRLLFDGDLQRPVSQNRRSPTRTSIEILQSCLDPFFIATLFATENESNVRKHGARTRFSVGMDLLHDERNVRVRDGLSEFAEFAAPIRGMRIPDLQRHVFPWSELVDRGFVEFPGSFAMVRLALIATAGKSPANQGAWSDQEFAPTAGLMARLFFARGKASDPAWWKERLANAKGDSTITCLAAILVWGIPDSASALTTKIGQIMDQLATRDWKRLRLKVRFMIRSMGDNAPVVSSDWFRSVRPVSARLADILIGLFGDVAAMREASRVAFDSYDGEDEAILKRAFDIEIGQPEDSVDWDYVLRLSAHSHSIGAYSWFSGGQRRTVPESVAVEVLRNCTNHCLGLVSICEAAYSNIVTRRSSKLSDLASSEQWFDTPK